MDIPHPIGIELAYTRRLQRRVATPTRRALAGPVTRWIAALRRQQEAERARGDTAPSAGASTPGARADVDTLPDPERVIGEARIALFRTLDLDVEALQAAQQAEAQTAQWNARQQGKALRVLGLDVFADDPGLSVDRSAFVRENVRLIRTVPSQHFEQIKTWLQDGIRDGKRHETFAGELADRLGLGERRAKLIARDQVSKHNGSLARVRQTLAGVTHYRWSATRDARTRPTHLALHGTVQAWASAPPGIGHPGEPIQCRCVAIPVLGKGEAREPIQFVSAPAKAKVPGLAKLPAIKPAKVKSLLGFEPGADLGSVVPLAETEAAARRIGAEIEARASAYKAAGAAEIAELRAARAALLAEKYAEVEALRAAGMEYMAAIAQAGPKYEARSLAFMGRIFAIDDAQKGAMRRAFADVVGALDGGGMMGGAQFRASIGDTPNAEMKKRTQTAADWLGQMFGSRFKARQIGSQDLFQLEVRITQDGRAGALYWDRAFEVTPPGQAPGKKWGTPGDGDDVATYLHEWVHVIEGAPLHTMELADVGIHGSPSFLGPPGFATYAHRAARAMHVRRTKGDPLRKLKDIDPTSDYSDNEVTREDKYFDAYAGKEYKMSDSWETLTMGYENIARNNSKLIQDHEYMGTLALISSGRHF